VTRRSSACSTSAFAVVVGGKRVAQYVDRRAAYVRAQRLDGGHERAGRAPGLEAVELVLDDGLGAGDAGPPRVERMLRGGAQVVDVVEEHAVETAGGGVDVARDREVEHEQRPIAVCRRGVDQRRRGQGPDTRPGSARDDVEAGQQRRQSRSPLHRGRRGDRPPVGEQAGAEASGTPGSRAGDPRAQG
jgi:hypothetical protein